MDTSLTGAAVFAVAFAALYAAHHVGDYWVQTDHQAQHKGDPHRKGTGRLACFTHVATYLFTQWAFLLVACAVTGLRLNPWAFYAALLVSGATHYWADRRWTLEWLVERMHAISPNKIRFLRLGTPRPLSLYAINTDDETGRTVEKVRLDNPTLGTGAWALDQSFHILFSVFAPALILAGLS